MTRRRENREAIRWAVAGEVKQWLADFRWAINMVRARRYRRRVLFSGRLRFDEAFRPRLKRGQHDLNQPVIAYPDAVYHTEGDDLKRAIRAAYEPYERSEP